MAKREKSYTIKIPVYTTEVFEKAKDIFGGITINDMILFLRRKASLFNENGSISYENRNKTRKTVISNISFTEHKLDESSCFLMQISAYSTNLYDGYLENDEKIKFQRDDKIGSDTNFVLIYPVISGLDRSNYMHYFLVLIYEDPTKNNQDIIKITKNVLNKVLEIPIANIKLPTILDELRKMKTIQELEVKYTALYNDENGVDIRYQDFLTRQRIKKQRTDNFRNMPFSTVEHLLNESNEEDYQKREVKLTNGKKEYRISKELINEASDALKETAEKIFNMTTSITPEEMNKLYELDFILEKMIPVLENYLSSSEND